MSSSRCAGHATDARSRGWCLPPKIVRDPLTRPVPPRARQCAAAPVRPVKPPDGPWPSFELVGSHFGLRGEPRRAASCLGTLPPASAPAPFPTLPRRVTPKDMCIRRQWASFRKPPTLVAHAKTPGNGNVQASEPTPAWLQRFAGRCLSGPQALTSCRMRSPPRSPPRSAQWRT